MSLAIQYWRVAVTKAVLSVVVVFGSALLAAAAFAAQPSFRGKWNITFCPYDRDFCAVTRCFDFVRVKGLIDGFPNSGTWTAPEAPSVNGRWVQLGEKVSFFASYPAGSDSYTYMALSGLMNGADYIGGVSLIEADRDYTLASTAAWYGQRVTSCPPPFDRNGGVAPFLSKLK
jgi:hypothetical protein